MTHILDHPIWSALATRHQALAVGDSRARRYQPDVVPFAAAADNAPDNIAALARLIAPSENIYVMQAGEIVLPEGFVAVTRAQGVQMVATNTAPPIADARIAPLGPGDAADMLALAALTKPGPFTMRALSLGRFWGVKVHGRLIAMAGERMAQPGFTELSGVCTHPDAQGQRLGRILSLFVADQIRARGDTPYLHAYATNPVAVKLYESIGFTIRCAMNVAIIARQT
ncbi:MAG: GNAT family N-acetyltransferase [Rhodospirillaceae bacterium]|nr:GNAT family N-acetyltransferase [Rhodospirillaceae bacterium]